MIEDPVQWLGLQLNLGKDGLRATVSYVNNRGLLLRTYHCGSSKIASSPYQATFSSTDTPGTPLYPLQ